MNSEKALKWKLSKKRNILPVKHLISEAVTTHPLLNRGGITIVNKNESASNVLPKAEASFNDPLSLMLESSDPLSSASLDCPLESSNEQMSKKSNSLENGVSGGSDGRSLLWEGLMSDFAKVSTKQRISLSWAIFATDGGSTKMPVVLDQTKGTSISSCERIKARLGHLESLDRSLSDGGSEGSSPRLGWTPEEFARYLVDLRQEMRDAWKDEQRIKALKIAIQTVKILSLSHPESFYPAKFSFCVNLLSSLGALVLARLELIWKSSHSTIYFSSKEEALETAQNWFLKVSSMKEILPRIYLEATLLPCYKLLPKERSSDALSRLINMCRCVGDPIVSTYARLYVVHCGLNFSHVERDHLKKSVEDTIVCMKWGWGGRNLVDIEFEVNHGENGAEVVESVFCPVLQYMLKYSCTAPEDVQHFLELCFDSDANVKYVLLKSMLKGVLPHLLRPNCFLLLQTLDECLGQASIPHECAVLISFVVDGRALSSEKRVSVLKGAWAVIQRMVVLDSFLKATAAWMEFVSKFFTIKELDKVLRSVLKRMSLCTTPEHGSGPGLNSIGPATSPKGPGSNSIGPATSPNASPHLLSLISVAINSFHPCQELFSLPSFRDLLNTFRREGSSLGPGHIDELESLLESVLDAFPSEFSDAETVSLLLSLFSSLKHGMTALTTGDEKRRVNGLVCAFVRRVEFGSRLDRTLDFYVEARAAFSGMDPVVETLVQLVFRLQLSALVGVNGNHTSRTAGFERACTAFCFISIPSLSSPLARFKLYILGGSVAMMNGCMGQGDAFVKHAIKTLPEIASDLSDKTIPEEDVCLAIIDSVGYLVAYPDPPDASKPLYLLRGFFKAIKFLSDAMEGVSFLRILVTLFTCVCAVSLESLPYKFYNVDGVDVLYGCDGTLQREAENLSSEILHYIMNIFTHLPRSGRQNESTSLVDVLCRFLNAIATYGHTADPDVRSVGVLLLGLLKKHGTSAEVLDFLQRKLQASVP